MRVIYVDTDSLVLFLWLTFDQEEQFYKKLVHIFDFSSLSPTDRLYSNHNSKTIGVFKDEVPNFVLDAFYTNGPKSYLYTLYDNTGIPPFQQTRTSKEIFNPVITLKGLPKFFQAKLLTTEDFKEQYNYPDKIKTLTYSVIRIGRSRGMYTFRCRKKS